MNVRLHLYPKQKSVKLKPHAVAKYCYYILIRFYYYFYNICTDPDCPDCPLHDSPLIFKKETFLNKRLRQRFFMGWGRIDLHAGLIRPSAADESNA